MNNRERTLTGKNLKHQKSRILKMEDGLWNEIGEVAKYMELKLGFHVSNSEAIRKMLTIQIKKFKEGTK
jgi:hypothetical protein